MAFLGLPILSTIVFLPLVGAVTLLLVPREREAWIRWLTLGFTAAVFVLSLPLFTRFNEGTAAFQFVEHAPWIPAYGISYKLGVDGISLLLVLLTTFLMPITVLSSWTAITQRVKEFHVSMLLLETGMLGVFTALDLVLFYVFWEAMLIPMYFIIGVWGGERRVYAAIKFFIYTMVGSLLMLVAILWLYFYHERVAGFYTFDLERLLSVAIPADLQIWMFLAFALSFAIKVPVFPFHTWLPDAHVEAPTAGSVILAGVLLKMGTYGYLRFCLPLFPNASHQFASLMLVLAVIGIIYGALVAMVQPDVKKLVAYSSVSHLGFVMLGIFAMTVQGLQGGILQMVNHGLSTGALFLIVGMIYERRHTRLIEQFGGLARPMPVFATLFMIVTLSSIGLPGLNGFVGEFLILLGTFLTRRVYAIAAATGVILAAVYMLWMYQRVMFGPCDKPENRGLRDLNLREVLVLVPIVAFIFLIGVYPRPFLKKTEASTKALLQMVDERRWNAPSVDLLEQAGLELRSEEVHR
ncbi:MAG: NADH-quinone oxidoreductase subunit M [candidate division KSB1 bacterium]|nr:NADH-quinone oxidoreductase subunit M [candidate division KSB1 bacterium]